VDPGQRPEPDVALKPSTLREISARSWWYLARRTLHEFLRDDCLDLAAGLTYFAVLAVLPGLIAVISLLGVLGKGPESVVTILEVARQVVPASALGILQPLVERLIQTPRANLALVLGILGALWFVSGYVTAFGRVMNRIYAIGEGRPIWKLQPLMILVTLVLGVLCLCAVLLLLISGPLARALGDVLGLGSTAVLVWNILRWPVVVAITAMMITLLYYVTPWCGWRLPPCSVSSSPTSPTSTPRTGRWPARSSSWSGCGSPTPPSCWARS
jgi:membrane protein